MFKITCVDCGREFTMTNDETKWYKDKGFEIPKRCPECRKRRKLERKNKNKGN